MNKIIFISAIALTFATTACSQKKQVEETETAVETEVVVEEEAENHFGEIVTAEGAMSVDEFANQMEGKDTINAKIAAIAEDVCQNKGCWMKVKMADGSLMRIKFKDYGFFVPMDITGKSVIFEGIAFKDTTSVEDLKHYAMDGGQSEEEIAAITEPEINTSFLASGVLIPQP